MSVSPEALLISSVLRDSDYSVAFKHGVTPDLFHGYWEEWNWIATYVGKYKKSPSKAAFKRQFPDFQIKAVNDTGLYADEVRKSHAKHELTALMNEAADFIADGDVTTASKKLQRGVVSITAGMGNHNDSDILRNYDDIMADIDARRQRVELTGSAGIPTGFETLDERTGGVQPGELWVFGARQGEGKSWFLQRMAANAVMNGNKVLFYGLEQTRSQVSMRIFSMLSGQMGKSLFDSQALMQGKDYDPRDFRRFVRGLSKQIDGALHVDDASRGRVSSLDIQAGIERHQPDIVFVDYINLLKRSSMEWQGMAELSSELTLTTVEYGLPIWAASQLNREHGLNQGKGKWQPPGSEALAQADAIGNDATGVITMSSPSPSVRVLYTAKARNSKSRFKFFAHFDPESGKFEEVSKTRAEDLHDLDLAEQANARR